MSSETSFEILIEIENGDSPSWKRQLNRYLPVSELISLGNLIKDSTAVSEKDLGYYIPERMRCNQHISNVLNMLQSHFPVLILHKKDCRYIINMHQIDFHNKELDALFEICDTGEKIPSAKEPKSVNAKSDKGGRNSILDKFPDIPVMRQIL